MFVMRSRRKCQYKGCNNVEKDCVGKRFFCFPNPDKKPDLFKQWAINSENLQIFNSAAKNVAHKRVCEDHFKESSFRDARRIKLRPNAVPEPWGCTHSECCNAPPSDQYLHLSLSRGEKNGSACQESSEKWGSQSCRAEKSDGEETSQIDASRCSSDISHIQYDSSELKAMHGDDFGVLLGDDYGTTQDKSMYRSTSLVSSEGESKYQVENTIRKGSVSETPRIRKGVTFDASVSKENNVPINIRKKIITQTTTSNAHICDISQTKCDRTRDKEGDLSGLECGNSCHFNEVSALKEALSRLEHISDKLAVASVADSYDQFGKYISSLLRGLPPRKVLHLKQKILKDVLNFMNTYENELPQNMMSKAVQANLILEESQKKNVTTKCQIDSIKAVEPIPLRSNLTPIEGNLPEILGKKRPLVFPTSSSSKQSFTLLPVIPISKNNSAISASTAVVSSTAANQCTDNIKTLARSSDGTLLAVTIPRTSITSSVDSTTLTSPKGQKRKKTTATYLIKRLPSQTEASAQTSVPTSSNLIADITNPVIKRSNNDEEFEMDFEEGNELKQIKEDQDLFETVICDNAFYIKEEAPDVDDTLANETMEALDNRDPIDGAPPIPSTSACPLTQLLSCDMCPAKCINRDYLFKHFSIAHPGWAPSAKEEKPRNIPGT